jgi:hypothetical protein
MASRVHYCGPKDKSCLFYAVYMQRAFSLLHVSYHPPLDDKVEGYEGYVVGAHGLAASRERFFKRLTCLRRAVSGMCQAFLTNTSNRYQTIAIAKDSTSLSPVEQDERPIDCPTLCILSSTALGGTAGGGEGP